MLEVTSQRGRVDKTFQKPKQLLRKYLENLAK